MKRPYDSPQVLEKYRAYLSMLVRLEIDSRLQGKLDASGVVQQTLIEAHRNFDEFRGDTEAQILAWLRQILAHNLADEIRKLEARKRDVRRERSLHAALDESHSRVEASLAADWSSNTQRLARQEQLVQLADALEHLPADQRAAIELHHLKGLPLAKIAAILKRSKGAVAQLLFRGLRNLRQQLDDADRSEP